MRAKILGFILLDTDRGAPPRGRSERMMGYGSSSTYSTTASADMERNKTEIAGDPLKAR